MELVLNTGLAAAGLTAAGLSLVEPSPYVRECPARPRAAVSRRVDDLERARRTLFRRPLDGLIERAIEIPAIRPDQSLLDSQGSS